ncbi:MAG: quinol monooxygenase YgiN [Saprospiraceae bacterium]|jgi:quinol monooxygenase YgiN
MRLAAGELSEEIGSVHGEPNTAYIISEWASMEAFQAFFSNPNLEKIMQEDDVIGKSTALILDQK